MKNALADFKNPGSEFRGKPFWAWNGKLEPEELRRQIRLMKKMGLGGFFMHARVGLDTAYLSDEWFECVDACIDEAKKLKMEAWLYDEDRWPSGAAGGIVTKNHKFRRHFLAIDVYDKPAAFSWKKETLAAFTACVKGDAASNVKQLAKGKKPAKLAEGESILAFTVGIDGDNAWFNGQAYLDTMNPAAVKEFIKVTHEEYRKRCGKELGRLIPGIFTDEPDYGSMLNFGNDPAHDSVAWTEALPKEFKKAYGYDLIPHLVELVYNVAGAEDSPARFHYHDCCTALFVNNFGKLIGEWCEKNNMQFTGHLMEEDTLSCQVNKVGDCMRFYEHMQAPGIDLLTEFWRIYDTAKQVTSAARQYGRKWRLTETYGCTGWDYPFAGHKTVGDWQAALGINLRAQHLFWYSMAGEAKRDYPAAISHQSPWWDSYPLVEDYFARVHATMTKGAEVRDLLVIHPVESTYLMVRKGWLNDPKVYDFNNKLVAVRDTLLSQHIDFDYASEEPLSRHGKVRVKDGKAELVVGKATYTSVLLPPMATIRKSTLDLLAKFRKAGGLVVFAGEVATRVEGVSSNAPAELARQCASAPIEGVELAKALESASRRINVTDSKGAEIPCAIYLLREDADASYLFICNTGHTPEQLAKHEVRLDVRCLDRKESFPAVAVKTAIEGAGQPEEWDCTTGERFAANAKKSGKGWDISTSLPQLGSRLFVFPKKAQNEKLAARPAFKTVNAKALENNAWGVTLSEANIIPLDRPRYRFNEGAWQPELEILRLDILARKEIGEQRRGGGMVQPWARVKPAKLKSVKVELEYEFQAETVPASELELAIEFPERYKAIAINGNDISPDTNCGFWVDKSLRRLPVDPSFIKPGKNVISMAMDYTVDDGFEIVYLRGAFGAKVDGSKITLAPSPAALKTGDWTAQGLPFYSGNVGYNAEIAVPKLAKGERLFVKLPEYGGVGARVLVDGQAAGVVAWDPQEVDISNFVSGKDKARLTIEVLGHRRNGHGPLHNTNRFMHWHGPDSFHYNEQNWTEGYHLVPCGLMAAPRLEVRSAE